MSRFLVCSIMLLCLAENAKADLILSWSGTTTSTGGTPIVAQLILTETGTNNISSFGLAGGSVAVTRSGVGNLVAVTASPLGSGQFDFSYATGGIDPTLTIDQTSSIGAGIGSSSIVLGTFTINATTDGIGSLSEAGLNNLPDDISVYTDAIGGFQNFGTGTAGNVFATAPTFNFTFTAVPEPTSLALVGLLSVGGLLARSRRRIATSSAA